jgi:very-short-patch-repair endonuclease
VPWNQAPTRSVSPRAAANAKTLRRHLTEPEKKLWWHLRHRLPLEHSHFRRQVAVGPYIADFCCLSARVIIEVDGNQHGTDQAVVYDARRATYLEDEGFRILRFSNFEMMREIDLVLDTIYAAIAGTTPTPGPSPQGGGEGGEA